jgi:hypothetical protein
VSLLDDIAQIVGDAIPAAGLTRDAVLTKLTDGATAPGKTSGSGNPTAQTFAAQGIVSDYNAFELQSTLIKAGDRKVKLIATTIAGDAKPEPNDRIAIEGATYVVIRVARDAASAVYTCQCRG